MKTRNTNTALLALIAITISLSSCTKSMLKIEGEGPLVTKNVDLNTLTGIDIRVEGDVVISQGESQEIRVEGQQNIIDNLEYKYRGETVIIKDDKQVRNHDGLTFYITLTDIEELGHGGVGEIRNSTEIISNNLSLVVSGAADINLEINSDRLFSNISGSGDINLTGEAKNQDVIISGSGNYRAFDLPAETCDVNISGSGKVKVSVNENLDVKISGSGNVYYMGYPSINSNISGSGHVISSN